MKKALIAISDNKLVKKGDVFILSENEKQYVCKYYFSCKSKDGNFISNYENEYIISTDYAQLLVNIGLLKEIQENTDNIFEQAKDKSQMDKVLEVKKPCFGADKGTLFELTEDDKYYKCNFYEDYKTDKMSMKFLTEIFVPVEYIKLMITNGYLKPFYKKEKNNDSIFINIFEEIDKLLNKYNAELSNIDKNMKDSPECLKVEKNTVLNNLVKVLTYLKSLKK